MKRNENFILCKLIKYFVEKIVKNNENTSAEFFLVFFSVKNLFLKFMSNRTLHWKLILNKNIENQIPNDFFGSFLALN